MLLCSALQEEKSELRFYKLTLSPSILLGDSLPVNFTESLHKTDLLRAFKGAPRQGFQALLYMQNKMRRLLSVLIEGIPFQAAG